MGLTSMLYKMARTSADVRAISRGPKAAGKRIVRKHVGRALASTGIFRWPK